MDLRLIPVCNDKDHEMEYKYKNTYNCDICHRKGISYRCINCEYSRCSKCHGDIMASEEISERLKKEKIKNDIVLAESKLKKDSLTDWSVMVSDGEICYVNKLMKTYSFDYPYVRPPEDSPNTKTEVRSKMNEEINSNRNHIRCSIMNIYGYITSYFS